MNNTPGLYDSRVPERPLRASGNLSYLDFIRSVEKVWSEAYPNVPFVASGVAIDGRYPCIVYRLVNRVPFPKEPKPRQREQVLDVPEGETPFIIMAQRFSSYVEFSAVDKVESDGAQVAEELIEQFEDFMLRFTPLWKYLGLSDFFYERRLADDEEPRMGEGVVKRSVVYRVTTEVQSHTKVELLERVLATVTVATIQKDIAESPHPYDDWFEWRLLTTATPDTED